MIASSAGLDAFILFLVALGLYFLPTIVAVSRKVPHIGSIVVINLFLGWTFIGWVVALVWSFTAIDRQR